MPRVWALSITCLMLRVRMHVLVSALRGIGSSLPIQLLLLLLPFLLLLIYLAVRWGLAVGRDVLNCVLGVVLALVRATGQEWLINVSCALERRWLVIGVLALPIRGVFFERDLRRICSDRRQIAASLGRSTDQAGSVFVGILLLLSLLLLQLLLLLLLQLLLLLLLLL